MLGDKWSSGLMLSAGKGRLVKDRQIYLWPWRYEGGGGIQLKVTLTLIWFGNAFLHHVCTLEYLHLYSWILAHALTSTCTCTQQFSHQNMSVEGNTHYYYLNELWCKNCCLGVDHHTDSWGAMCKRGVTTTMLLCKQFLGSSRPEQRVL